MENKFSERNATLSRFWEHTRTVANRPAAAVTTDEWNEQVYYLSQSGRGIEEALRYLYSNQPSLDAFMDWLKLTTSTYTVEVESPRDSVLTAEDRNSWDSNGYLVIKNAVSPIQCEEAREAIWKYLDADPLQTESWYRPNEGKNGMMLNLFHHPAIDNNRKSGKIRKVYEELYNSTDIYLLMDKVSFNPPETRTYKFTGSPLHWDVSLQLPIPFVLQGLLYLNDVGEDDGAFNCVPGFHNKIDEWLAGLAVNVDPREAALTELTPRAIPGNAGDLIIWHQGLPHRASPNKGSSPRMVQYIAYRPVKTIEHSEWK
ncbi:MAG: phytanoyl-CoA dioxygenase family protein [Ginsengibacter sp.]